MGQNHLVEKPTMTTRRNLLGTAIAAVLMGGCGTSPPRAGFTNGEKPTFSADEKPGVRDDLQTATPDSGDAKLAGSAANIPDPGTAPPSETEKPKPAPTEPPPK